MVKQHGPWKIIESMPKYKNPWIKVTEDQVIRPDGKKGIFGLVDMKDGVSVLPIDDEGFAYLTEEFHYAIGRKSIEAVSGAIDGDETAIDCAKRELFEELGIEAEEWVDLGVVNPFTEVINSSAQIFLCRKLQFSKNDPDGTENIKPKKMKFEEAHEMVMKSEINHGPSCVLILKAKEYLEK